MNCTPAEERNLPKLSYWTIGHSVLTKSGCDYPFDERLEERWELLVVEDSRVVAAFTFSTSYDEIPLAPPTPIGTSIYDLKRRAATYQISWEENEAADLDWKMYLHEAGRSDLLRLLVAEFRAAEFDPDAYQLLRRVRSDWKRYANLEVDVQGNLRNVFLSSQ